MEISRGKAIRIGKKPHDIYPWDKIEPNTRFWKKMAIVVWHG